MITPTVAIKRKVIVPGCTRFISPNNAGPLVYNGLEQDAAAHWLFGTDHTNLVDLVNAQSLTVQDNSHLPAFSSGYLTTNGSASPPGLQTPFNDSNDSTWVAVIQPYLMGGGAYVFDSIDGSGKGRGVLLNSAGESNLYADGLNNNAVTHLAAPDEPFPALSTSNPWLFVALAFASANGGSTTLFYGYASGCISYPMQGTGTPSTGKVSFAHNGNGSPLTNTLNFAEGIIYSRGLTIFELTALYNRRKTALAARGITVA